MRYNQISYSRGLPEKSLSSINRTSHCDFEIESRKAVERRPLPAAASSANLPTKFSLIVRTIYWGSPVVTPQESSRKLQFVRIVHALFFCCILSFHGDCPSCRKTYKRQQVSHRISQRYASLKLQSNIIRCRVSWPKRTSLRYGLFYLPEELLCLIFTFLDASTFHRMSCLQAMAQSRL